MYVSSEVTRNVYFYMGENNYLFNQSTFEDIMPMYYGCRKFIRTFPPTFLPRILPHGHISFNPLYGRIIICPHYGHMWTCVNVGTLYMYACICVCNSCM